MGIGDPVVKIMVSYLFIHFPNINHNDTLDQAVWYITGADFIWSILCQQGMVLCNTQRSFPSGYTSHTIPNIYLYCTDKVVHTVVVFVMDSYWQTLPISSWVAQLAQRQSQDCARARETTQINRCRSIAKPSRNWWHIQDETKQKHIVLIFIL